MPAYPMRISMKFVPAAILILILTFSAASARRYNQASSPLFLDTNLRGTVDFSGDPTLLRSRYVTANLYALEGAGDGETLELNLFEDAKLTAVIEGHSSQAGTDTWTGHVQGAAYSQVTLVSSQGQMAGNIVVPGAFYQVRYAGNGLHAIRQIDQSAFPPELEPIQVSAPPGAEAMTRDPLAPMDDGSVIDVLVVYTPAARNAAGGTTAMQNLINLAVTETNQSYANSGITQRLNLAHVEEVTYTESVDMGTDLDRLQGTSDSYMNNVHSLRNTYYADTVSLVVESSQYCGIGFMMDPVASWFESYAFSVVARNCATGYYSFGHELGHNMGARHDWFVDNATTPYTYSHGYLNVTGRWRTIMAYNNECQSRGVNCARLPYWSNPGVSYGGAPMGVPGGTSTSCTPGNVNHPACDADDHRTLNNSAYTVANFRVRASGPTPTPTRTATTTPTRTPTPTPTRTPTPTATIPPIDISLNPVYIPVVIR